MNTDQKIVFSAGINVLVVITYFIIRLIIDSVVDDGVLSQDETCLFEQFMSAEMMLVIFLTWFVAIGSAIFSAPMKTILLVGFVWPYSFFYLYERWKTIEPNERN